MNTKKILHIEHPDKPYRVQAAYRVAENWRIRQRLPLITKLAIKLGIIQYNQKNRRYQMPNTKFTPGPWTIHENKILEIHPAWDEHGEYVIAEIPNDAKGNRQANARVIAAAPEMYAVLKKNCQECRLRIERFVGASCHDIDCVIYDLLQRIEKKN